MAKMFRLIAGLVIAIFMFVGLASTTAVAQTTATVAPTLRGDLPAPFFLPPTSSVALAKADSGVFSPIPLNPTIRFLASTGTDYSTGAFRWNGGEDVPTQFASLDGRHRVLYGPAHAPRTLRRSGPTTYDEYEIKWNGCVVFRQTLSGFNNFDEVMAGTWDEGTDQVHFGTNRGNIYVANQDDVELVAHIDLPLHGLAKYKQVDDAFYFASYNCLYWWSPQDGINKITVLPESTGGLDLHWGVLWATLEGAVGNVNLVGYDLERQCLFEYSIPETDGALGMIAGLEDPALSVIVLEDRTHQDSAFVIYEFGDGVSPDTLLKVDSRIGAVEDVTHWGWNRLITVLNHKDDGRRLVLELRDGKVDTLSELNTPGYITGLSPWAGQCADSIAALSFEGEVIVFDPETGGIGRKFLTGLDSLHAIAAPAFASSKRRVFLAETSLDKASGKVWLYDIFEETAVTFWDPPEGTHPEALFAWGTELYGMLLVGFSAPDSAGNHAVWIEYADLGFGPEIVNVHAGIFISPRYWDVEGVTLIDRTNTPAPRWISPITPYMTTTVARTASAPPDGFSLAQNYPNPFNPSTTIRFALPEAGEVTLAIFDLIGRKVATLVEGKHAAGTHFAVWDAAGFSSGIYFYQLETVGTVIRKRMTLLK